jgi:hypothetical protein
MPSVPYARLLVSVNGGAYQTGKISPAYGDAIQLVGEVTAGWDHQIWEIVYYPATWATPSGWTLDPVTGFIYSTAVQPPSFTLPPDTLWGKWLFRLRINDAITNDKAETRFTDTASGLSIESSHTLRDLGSTEKAQYDKDWARDHQHNLRALDSGMTGGGGPPTGAAGGDLGGTYPNPNVLKIHGATVPAAGGLTTGNGLYVSAGAALTYSALNLAGGATWVTGRLPHGNIDFGAANTVFVTNGAANANAWALLVDANVDPAAGIVVSKLGQSGATTGQAVVWNGSTWIPGTPTGVGTGSITPGTVGQFLVTAAGPATAWASPAGDWDGVYTATKVRGLTGTTNVVAMHGTTILWDTTVVATLKGADVTTNGGTAPSFTIQAANETGTTSVGGALILTSGTGTSTNGAVNLQSGGTTVVQLTSAAKLTLFGAGTLTSNTAVPSAAEVDGSIYTRTGGANGSLWGRENGIWVRYLSTGTLPPSTGTVQIVADMPALEALLTTSLLDRILCIVQTPPRIYWLDKGATPAASGDDELPPANPSGAWRFKEAA